MIVTIDDIRKAGICVAGARAWFKQNGLDFADMLENGIPAEILAATGDAMALKVVASVEERDNG